MMQAERSPDAKDINGAEEDFPKQIMELTKECVALTSEISRLKRPEIMLSKDAGRFQVFSEYAPFGLILIDKEYAQYRGRT
jgi:hypothetical protein